MTLGRVPKGLKQSREGALCVCVYRKESELHPIPTLAMQRGCATRWFDGAGCWHPLPVRKKTQLILITTVECIEGCWWDGWSYLIAFPPPHPPPCADSFSVPPHFSSRRKGAKRWWGAPRRGRGGGSAAAGPAAAGCPGGGSLGAAFSSWSGFH